MALAVWTAVALPALILMVGLGVDFSGHATAELEARSVAAEAARAAVQEVRVGAEGTVVNVPAALQAATSFVAAAGYDGEVDVDSQSSVTVTVRGSYPTLFLGLIGVNEIPVEVTGSARVIAAIDGTHP